MVQYFILVHHVKLNTNSKCTDKILFFLSDNKKTRKFELLNLYFDPKTQIYSIFTVIKNLLGERMFYRTEALQSKKFPQWSL